MSALVLALSACGDDPLVTATVTSIMEGTIRDGLTRQPIEGATVRVLGARGANGSVEVVTDADGHYKIVFGGGGRFNYQVQADGFARMQSSVTFDPNDYSVEGTDGSYTITQLVNQDVYPLTGTLVAHVYGTQFRDWISDAPVTFQYSGSIDDTTLPVGATTDDEGTIEIANLPAGVNLNVTVRAIDRDGDGVLDTTGTSYGVTLEAGASTEIFIGPVGSYNGPGLLWSNIDDMRTFPANATFTFIYRSAMDTDASSVTTNLRDSYYGVGVSAAASWSADGTTLTITPSEDLVPGREYYLYVTAWSALGEQVNAGTYRFRIEGGADDEPQITGLEWLDDPTEQELFDNAFRIAMDPIDNVDRIKIFGRNTVRSSDWVYITDVYPTPGFPKMEFTININGYPATLLSSFPNGPTTFFGLGETLELAAAAVIGEVEGPISAPIELRDEKCIDAVLQMGTDNTVSTYFDNSGGTEAKPILIRLSTNNDYFSEGSVANLTIANGLFSTSNYVLRAADLVTTRVDRGTFDMEGTIPADRDAQLDLVTVDLASLQDPSGNPVCQTELAKYTPGENYSDPFVWDFEANAQGWTATGGFTRGSGASWNGTSNVWSTGLTGPRANATESTLTSPTILMPNSGYQIYWYDRRETDVVDEYSFVELYEEDGEPVEDAFSVWTNFSSWGQVGATAIQTSRPVQLQIRYSAGTPAAATTATGFWLDDVSFAGAWSRDLYYDGEN